MAADETNILETSTGEVTPPTALRTAEEIAATSHLQNVHVPGADADSGETAAETALDLKLPKSLKAAHALLNEIQEYQPKAAADAKKKAASIAALTAHIHKLGQGNVLETIHGEDHAGIAEAGTSHAQEIHITQLCQRDFILNRYVTGLKAQIKSQADEIAKLTKPVD